MKLTKVSNRIALISYISIVALCIVGAVVCAVSIIDIQGKTYEGWEGLGAGISAAIFLILAIIAIVIALYTLIPLTLKAIAIKKDVRGPSIACIVFDILMIIVAMMAALLSLIDTEFGLLIPVGIVGLLYILTLVCNCISLRR